MKKYLLLFTLLIFLSSCSKTFYYVDAFPHTTQKEVLDSTKANLDVDVNVAFGGDALDYFVFELDIKNRSDKMVFLSSQDVHIIYKDDSGQLDGLRLDAIDKNLLLDQLEQEKLSLKKEKRINNVSNFLITGLGILGSIFTGDPIYAADVIVEGTADLISDRRFYKLVSEDIDVQMEYIQDWVIEDLTIRPGESISYDILFEAIEDPTYSEVNLIVDTEKFTFPFDMILRKGER